MEKYVLDTSALITLKDDEEGADIVENILEKARSQRAEIWVSFMSFMEVAYEAWRNQGKASAHQALLALKMLPIERVDPDDALLFKASEIKATHPMSVADSWIAATALEKEAILVHKDPEFESLEGKVRLKHLPYK